MQIEKLKAEFQRIPGTSFQISRLPSLSLASLALTLAAALAGLMRA